MPTKRVPTRKRLRMMVTVSVPFGMGAHQARREVKSLITDQCNFAAEPEDVKAISVRPAGYRGSR